jgi:type IV secretion system protein TrbG
MIAGTSTRQLAGKTLGPVGLGLLWTLVAASVIALTTRRAGGQASVAKDSVTQGQRPIGANGTIDREGGPRGDVVTASRVVAGAADSAAKPATGASLPTAGSSTTDGDPVTITAATREYRRTGVARIVHEGSALTFPYGHAQPIITCAPLRVCILQLDSGEAVLSKIIGDSRRWEVHMAVGGVDGKTTLVAIKPTDCNLTTNLFLSTTKGRGYDLTLDSPPCARATVSSARNPIGSYTRYVRFYYPDEMVETTIPLAQPASSISAAPPGNATVVVSPNVESYNFEYGVVRDKHFPWTPIAVFDDHVHCYIKLPLSAAHGEAAVLFIVNDDGSKTLLNYSIQGDTYISDRVFVHGLLMVTDGGKQVALHLENRGAVVPGQD